MQAMIINKTGGPEVFELAEIATPTPGPGEVLIEIAYAGVNPADWKNRQGMLAQYRPYVFPYIIGFDAAGVVAALGVKVVRAHSRAIRKEQKKDLTLHYFCNSPFPWRIGCDYAVARLRD